MNNLAKIFTGSFGSGKTYNAIKSACDYLGVENSHENFVRLCEEKRIAFIPLSPNFGYENFVMGVRVSTDQNGRISYQIADKIFSEMCSEALSHRDLKYCVILDDLDRINISSLLGELINAIEYRNERITTTGGKSLIVPDNLLIIGTVNSLNRSEADYAVLRRFNMEPLKPTKRIISEFYSDYSEETVESIVGFYEAVNSFIDSNISADYSALVNEYHIGPSFYLKKDVLEENLLNVVSVQMKYIVFPILRQYVSEGILDCSFENVCSFQESLMPVQDEQQEETNKVKKFEYNNYRGAWEECETVVSDVKQAYLNVLNGRARGYKAELFKLIFEAVCFSGIISTDKIFNNILNNTNLIKVSNRFARNRTQELYAAFVAEESISEQFQYITQSGSINCSVYATTAVGNKMKPRYDINGRRYVVASGFRDSGTIQNLDTYEPTLMAPLYHAEFVYKLVASYYNLLIQGFAQTGNDLLYKLAVSELNYISTKENFAQNWPVIMSKPVLLWSAAEDSIFVTESDIRELEVHWNYPYFAEMYEEYLERNHTETLLIPKIGVKNMANDYKRIMDLLNIHQMILQGPPGTSKTYGAKRFIGERIV